MSSLRRIVGNINCVWKNQRKFKSINIASCQFSHFKNTHFTLPRAGFCIQGNACHRTFHTSARKNAIGPLLWPFVKLVMKGASILTGRSVRIWWKALPGHEKQSFLHLTKKQWKLILAGLAGAGTLTYAYYQSHIEAAPITGRKRFIALTDSQLNAIVEVQAEELIEENQGIIVPANDPAYKKLEAIFHRLWYANSDVPGIKDHNWRLIIIDDPKNINAFVLPTGHVFVYTGLINFLQNDDELAIVLGHEMAHAIMKHAAESLSSVQFIDYFVIILMAALWIVMPGDGIAAVFNWFLHHVIELMIHMPHSRLKETEADKVGLELASKACFDIRSGTVVWTKMEVRQKLAEEKIPEWLSTHPVSEKRAEFFDHFIPEYTEMRNACKCPPLPGKDPRQCLQDLKKLSDSVVVSNQARGNIDRMKLTGKQSPQQKSTVFKLTEEDEKKSQTVIQDKVTSQSVA